MQITYKDKVTLQSNPNIPDENKVTAKDMNEIKSAVNSNEEEQQALNMSVQEIAQNVVNNSQEISNIKEEQTTQNDNIQTNSNNISDLQSNKADKSEIPTDLSQLSNENTKFVNETGLENAISQEKTQRQNADNNLQNQVDTNKTNIQTNATNIATNTQEINTIKAEQTTQNNRLNSLEVDNTTNKSDILTNKQDINNIKTEQTTQNTNISTNATNIESLQEENENLKKIVAQMPQVEGQGTEITLENTIEAPFTKFDVEGNSVQDGTPSPDNEQPIYSAGDNENLLPANNGSETIDGVNFTKNSDGTIIANGTATTGINYYINGLDYENIPAGEYTLSDGVGTSGGESSNTFFTFLDGAPNSNSTISLPTFTLSQATNVRGRIVIRSGATLDNVVFKPKLEKGNKATPYSPYGMGSINEKINNLSSLLDWNKFIDFSNWKASNSSGYMSFEISGLTSGKTYTLCRKNSDGYSKGMYAAFNRTNNNSNLFIHSSNKEYNKQNISVDISGSSSLYIVFSMSNATQLQNYINLIQDCWVIEGDSFKEKEEQDYSIFVQQPMRSIGDVRDLFFKNTVDNPYYDENLTLNGWYERHYITQLGLDGTENWSRSDTTGFMRYVITLANMKSVGSARSTDILCNIFNPSTENGYNNCFAFNNTVAFYVPENIEDFGGFKELLQEKNAKLQYELAEPLDLPCTETQIQQIENRPSTYKDFTIINSEDETPAYLEVSGIRDIDTMFDKVTNAIVSLGGNV